MSSAADTGVTDDTDRKTSSHTSKTDRKASAELDEPRVEGVAVLLEAIGNENRDDETVDTDDTGHNDGDNVWRGECVNLTSREEAGPGFYPAAVVNILLTIRSGRRTPMAEIPTPDLAVPYEAPRQQKTMAAVQPMAPKKGWVAMSVYKAVWIRMQRRIDASGRGRHRRQQAGGRMVETVLTAYAGLQRRALLATNA